MAVAQKKKLKRAEKAEENRKTLIEAAADVVGRYGYANASISRITEKAGLAQGTFYLYFESRQHLFDQLLPAIGEEMVAYIGQAVKGSKDLFEVEERGLTAFFDFLSKRKAFFRILYEADMVSEISVEKHYTLLAQKYEAVVKRALAEAQIRPLSPVDVEVLIYLMMGARDYLYRNVIAGRKKSASEVKEVVQAYVSILRRGLQR